MTLATKLYHSVRSKAHRAMAAAANGEPARRAHQELSDLHAAKGAVFGDALAGSTAPQIAVEVHQPAFSVTGPSGPGAKAGLVQVEFAVTP